MQGWQFPTKEEWLRAWEAAHVVYAEEIDPDEDVLCQALLWQARAICYKHNEQN